MEFNKTSFKINNSPVIGKQNEHKDESKSENNTEKNIFENSTELYLPAVGCMSEKEIAELNFALANSRIEAEEQIKSDLDDTFKAINRKTKAESIVTMSAISKYKKMHKRSFFDDVAAFYPDKKDDIFENIIKKIDDPKIMAAKNSPKPYIACDILKDCIINHSDANLEFVEKFVDNCSEESLNGILKKGSLDRYANYYAPNSSLANKLTEKYLDVRGKLNDGTVGDSSQGNIADCWLLSGINAMRYTEKGQEILNNAISNTENGYSVRFEGLNKDIEITKDDITNAIQSGKYSTGDTDVLLYELAFEKGLDEGYIKHNILAGGSAENTEEASSLDGGSAMTLIYALTGKKSKYALSAQGCSDEVLSQSPVGVFLTKTLKAIAEPFVSSGNESILDKISNSENVIASVSFMFENNGKERYLTDIDGNKHEVSGVDVDSMHECAIKSIDGDLVTIVNPWNSKENIVITREELLKNAFAISYCDLSDV